MPVFGIDDSDFQSGLEGHMKSIKQQGFEFVIPKCTEGSTWKSVAYPEFHAEVQANGMLFAAYHFLHHGDIPGQVANFLSHVGDKSIPVMIDLEAELREPDATIADAAAFRAALKKAGHTGAVLLYIPKWYWSGRLGSPSLAGWQIVSSAYPSRRHEYASVLYPGDSAAGWAPYGGATPVLYQFASTGKLDGYAGNVDCDAFAGTIDELRSRGIFKDYGSHVTPTPKPAPKPVPTPSPKPGSGNPLIVLGWNAWMGNTPANVKDALDRWQKEHKFHAACISEARSHWAVLAKWAHDNGFTLYQRHPGADLPGGVVNETGDTAILLVDSAARQASNRVAQMRLRWKDFKHNRIHSGRQAQIVKFPWSRRKVRLRADHLATLGVNGPNRTAWLEGAVRLKAWLLAGLGRSASVDVLDANETKAAVAQWMGKRFSIAGDGIDLAISHGVASVDHVQLDKGGSDTHHGQLYTIHL